MTGPVRIGLERNGNHQYRWNGGPWLPGATGIIRLQDSTGGSDGLINWAVGLAVDEVLRNILEREPNDWSVPYLEAIRTKAKLAVERPRNEGSEVHDAIDALLSGRDLAPNAVTGPYFYGIAKWLVRERPEPIVLEQMVANLTLGYGGTFDFAGRIGGRIALVDFKTGKYKRSQALQLAAYQMAEFIGREGDGTKYDVPRFEDFYLVFLRPDGYEQRKVAVGKAEREHFAFLVDAVKRMKAWDKAEGSDLEEVAA